MSAPRLEIDLGKIQSNARTLIQRLAAKRIAVTAVMKATLGAPGIADALLQAGVQTLGDARIENIIRMRQSGVTVPLSMIRSPMLSQVTRIVNYADLSFNTRTRDHPHAFNCRAKGQADAWRCLNG